MRLGTVISVGARKPHARRGEERYPFVQGAAGRFVLGRETQQTLYLFFHDGIVELLDERLGFAQCLPRGQPGGLPAIPIWRRLIPQRGMFACLLLQFDYVLAAQEIVVEAEHLVQRLGRER